MKVRAGRKIWRAALAVLLSQSYAYAADSDVPVGTFPEQGQVIPVSALQDEDASAPGSIDTGIIPPEEGIAPLPPTGTPSFAPTYQGMMMADRDRFYQLQMGTYAGENTGVTGGFMSLEGRGGLFTDGGEGLFFTDGRLLLNEFQHAGANLGLGYRRFLPGPEMVFGANIFYDHWNTGQFGFNQIGVGAELLGSVNEFRTNVYAPVGTRTQQVGQGVGFVVGNDIFTSKNLQTSLAGFDMEYGRLLMSRERMDFRGFLGGYYYSGSGADDGVGVRVRGELALGDFTRLNLSVQNDSIFDTTVMFGAEFQLPGRSSQAAPYRPNAYSRMYNRVERVQNIAVYRRTSTQNTGLQAFFVQEGAAGDGVQANPYSLADLTNDPTFGAGDYAVLMGGGGVISGNVVLSAGNQGLIGSADGSGNATTILPDGSILNLTGLGPRATLDGQIQFQNSGFATGFDINSTGDVPILVDGLGAGQVVSIDNVNILGSPGNGITIVNSPGEFQFLAGTTGGLIQDVAGNGIQVTGSTDVLLDNVTFNNIGGNAIVTNYTGTFVATGDTVINNPGLNGIYLNNNKHSNFIFENLYVTGGGNGLFLDGFTGDFTVTGDAFFHNQVSTAILHPASASGNTSNLSFGSLSVSKSGSSGGGYGVALENHQGTFTVEKTATISGNPAVGLLVKDSHTDFEFGNLVMSGFTGYGLSLENSTGDINVKNSISLTGTNAAIGLYANNSTSDISAKMLNISGVDGVGAAFQGHTGTLHVEKSIDINSRDTAMLIRNGHTDVETEYLKLFSGQAGLIAFDGNHGDYTVHKSATLTGNGGANSYGILSRNSSGDYSFGELNINNTAMHAVSLDGHTGDLTVEGDANFHGAGYWATFGMLARNSTGDIGFGSLDIKGFGGYGVSLDGYTGDFSVDNEYSYLGNENINAYGLLARNSKGDLEFGSIDISNVGSYGVALQNLTGDFLVHDEMKLTNTGNSGLLVEGGGKLEFGSIDISGVNHIGVSVNGGSGDFLVNGDVNIVAGHGHNNVVGSMGDLQIQNGSYGNVTSGNNGIMVRNRKGDISFDSLTASNTKQAAVVFDNITGDITITGDVNLNNVDSGSYHVPALHAMQVVNSQGDVELGSLNINGTGITGLDFRGNQGDLTIGTVDDHSASGWDEQKGFTSTGFRNGMHLSGNQGDVNLGFIDVTGVGGSNSGVIVQHHTGDVNVHGDTKLSNTGENGLSVRYLTGDLNLAAVDIQNNSVTGMDLAHITGDVNVTGDTTLKSTGDLGIQIDHLNGTANFTNLDISDTKNAALSMIRSEADLHVSGDVVIKNPGTLGVYFGDVEGEVTFGSLDINGATAAGMSVYNSDIDLEVSGKTTISESPQGIVLRDTKANLTFDSLDIHDTTVNGLSLDGHTGDITVTGDADFKSTGNNAILSINGSHGDFSFGNLTVSNNTGVGISLNKHTGDFTVTGDAKLHKTGSLGIYSTDSQGNFSFGSLDVSNNSNNAIGLIGHSGEFEVLGDTILKDVGSNGILAQYGSKVDFSFNNLDISGISSSGIALAGNQGDFTSTGITTITQPGTHGILVQDFAGVMEFNELNISNPGSNGVSLSLFDGEFISNGGTISGIKSGQNAIFKHDTGNGSVSLSDMIFTSDSDNVFGMVTLSFTDGGEAILNNNQVIFAENSTGTIGYRLGSYEPWPPTHDPSDPAKLSGSGNTTTNAVQKVQIDTDPASFEGTIEIDGTNYPIVP